jgi:hypothetical protein
MEEEVQQQTSVYVSSDKAALIASLRAKAKRDREVATGDVKEEIEEGEVVEEKERENLLVIELDLISSDGDDNEEVFEETSTPHRLNQQETIARLQEMIEEKEQAKLRANRPVDVSLLKTKTLAQESLLQRVTDECRELSRQKKTLKRQIEHTWAKELKQTRTHIERLNAMMVTAESRVTQILRRQEEAGAELVTVQQSLVEKLELQEGLRSKLKATKQELDALAHAAPSVQQLERAQWLMNAFVVADRGADSVVRASFGHFWASEARDECARVFRALGEKTQREAADQGRRKEEPSFLEPYRSPLLAFHSYRLFPSFMAVMVGTKLFFFYFGGLSFFSLSGRRCGVACDLFEQHCCRYSTVSLRAVGSVQRRNLSVSASARLRAGFERKAVSGSRAIRGDGQAAAAAAAQVCVVSGAVGEHEARRDVRVDARHSQFSAAHDTASLEKGKDNGQEQGS